MGEILGLDKKEFVGRWKKQVFSDKKEFVGRWKKQVFSEFAKRRF